MKNVVLIGLPGSGKTTLGEALARDLNRGFYDVDRLIEAQSEMPVNAIFESLGEECFRELETEAVRRLAAKKGAVISTGGGTVLWRENIDMLRENGMIAFIDRPPSDIAHDVDCDVRPLLKAGAEKLYELAASRREKYLGAADFTIKNDVDISEALNTLKRMVYVSEEKKLFRVIGDPIGHSLSPAIHNYAFELLGVNAVYEAELVPGERLSDFVRSSTETGISGFNVTIPHKQDIIPLLHKLDDEAERCGAVNTVLVRDGMFYGHNTDTEGLSMALKDDGASFCGSRVLILGTGGAAAAIAFKAAAEGALCVSVVGRNVSKARDINKRLSADSGCEFICGDFSSLPDAAKRSNLVINATPLGMKGCRQDFESLEFLGYLEHGSLVCDLVYNPPETALMAKAKEKGLKTQNGFSMLVYQALIADELFLDINIDKKAMFDMIKRKLEGGTAL